MFAVPRQKKSVLPPPKRKRSASYNIEEISFDNTARHEYLTGFHKRKQARIKHAQEENAKKAHQEKLEHRKQLREKRRRDAEEHVENVEKLLRESNAAAFGAEAEDEEDKEEDGVEEADTHAWEGFPDKPDLEIVDHEEEYIDEDRYTSVTVESVAISRDGLEKRKTLAELVQQASDAKSAEESVPDAKARRPPKTKKKKFRYESKIERQLEQGKQRAKRPKQ